MYRDMKGLIIYYFISDTETAHWTLQKRNILISYNLYYFNLHAGRNRETSFKAHRFSISTRLSRHCVLNDESQCHAINIFYLYTLSHTFYFSMLFFICQIYQIFNQLNQFLINYITTILTGGIFRFIIVAIANLSNQTLEV